MKVREDGPLEKERRLKPCRQSQPLGLCLPDRQQIVTHPYVRRKRKKKECLYVLLAKKLLYN